MDLKEAYEVIKKEWHAAERKVKKLEKELEKLRKEGASGHILKPAPEMVLMNSLPS